MKWICSFLFIIVLFITGCNRKIVLPNAYDMPMLSFGHGGGFTGIEKQYILQTDGNFFEKTFNQEEYTHLNRIKAQDCTQLFENYKKLELNNIKVNQPENIYYYIEYISDGEQKKLTWGNSYKENHNLMIFYQTLMHLTNTENSK